MISNIMILETLWIVGFCDGEANFHIGINKNAQLALGYQVLLEFNVTQHLRSISVLSALKAYFGGGVIRRNKGKAAGSAVMIYRVRDFKQLSQIIVPFFEKHSLKTTKNVQFLKWRDVVLMMQRREHLTEEGLDKIRKIRAELEALEHDFQLPTDLDIESFNKDESV
jgi:hypothetical protein